MTATDESFSALKKVAENEASLSVDDKIDVQFALGKAYLDLGQFERSLRHFIEGNFLKRRSIVYDEAGQLDFFRRISDTFNSDLVHKGAGVGNNSHSPIFVIGMPRSGTTLVEQVLASHPEVFGAGERIELEQCVSELISETGISYPEFMRNVSVEQLRRLGANYLERVAEVAPAGVKRIVDKQPQNFFYVGLIHLALPNARIVHVRRDPLDTCLSCFSKLFAGNHSYSYELGELGRYYRAYQQLMAHWGRVLPTRAILHVQYEELISDFEREARRLVDYCGLDWDPACLSFHENRRPVRTASSSQVRKPLYTTSVGRSRHYGDLLQELVRELDGGL